MAQEFSKNLYICIKGEKHCASSVAGFYETSETQWGLN